MAEYLEGVQRMKAQNKGKKLDEDYNFYTLKEFKEHQKQEQEVKEKERNRQKQITYKFARRLEEHLNSVHNAFKRT